MAKPLTYQIADWAYSLKYDDIPSEVKSLCRHQTASVLAACFGADHLPATEKYRRILSNVCGGKTKAAPFFDSANPAAACGITAALSAALDFDDYLFMGHTGHSAVSVPLVLGTHLRSGIQEAMIAQVVANELGGRLGASVVLGPHNGQLWTFIHAGAASLATSRLLGLGPKRAANALALAFAAPPFPSFSSLMGPDSKLSLISEPTMAGVRAAFLAKEGITGPIEILDEDKGFFGGFCFAPARFFLEGFGQSWVTQSIAIKPYPGCAYVDSVVDSMLDIMEEFKIERGRKLMPKDVSDIHIEATLLTTQMETLGRAYGHAGELPPTFNLNFRVPQTVAITIIAGCLTSAEFALEFLASNKKAILQLTSRIRLFHNWKMTLAVVRALSDGLEPFSILSHLSLREIYNALKEAKRKQSHELPFTLSDLPAIFKVVKLEDIRNLRDKMNRSGMMAEVDFGRLKMPFAAKITLKTTDGKRYEADREFPDGTPGGKSRELVASEKFLQEASIHMGKERAKNALSGIQKGQAPADILATLK